MATAARVPAYVCQATAWGCRPLCHALGHLRCAHIKQQADAAPRGGVGLEGGGGAWRYTRGVRGADADGVGDAESGKAGRMVLFLWGKGCWFWGGGGEWVGGSSDSFPACLMILCIKILAILPLTAATQPQSHKLFIRTLGFLCCSDCA